LKIITSGSIYAVGIATCYCASFTLEEDTVFLKGCTDNSFEFIKILTISFQAISVINFE
jgi:hypothetical protein